MKDSSSNRNQDSKLFLSTFKRNKIKKNSRNNTTRDFISKYNQKLSSGKIIFSTDSNNLKIENKKSMEMNKLNTLEKEDEINTSNRIKSDNIRFSFNLCEIIISLLCPCYLSGNLKIKNEFNEKAIDFLYNKLDIILYTRNMILLDIINQTLLDDYKKDIINFLSRPILYLDGKDFKEKKPDIFYLNYTEEDFDKFADGFLNLFQKADKKNREKKLTELSKQKLKELI